LYEPGVSVRPPSRGDEEGLARLIYRFYAFNEEFDPAWALGENAEEDARREAEKLAAGETSDIVLVAEVDGELVGYVRGVIRRFPLLKDGAIGVITELYVHPKYRGRRIGAVLIERFSDEARRRGAVRIAAEVPSRNVVAEKFYEKLGFRRFMETFVKEV
jgi:ribosomal protein S18 acetylase RimI-like enzyme